MGWGIKRELSLTDCVQNTYCALNAAYRLRAGYKTLVKLHMCYHPKMAGIGGKGCNCFTYWFFFSRRVLIVKWLTGCCYLHGEAMDNFRLHMFENSPLLFYISHYLLWNYVTMYSLPSKRKWPPKYSFFKFMQTFPADFGLCMFAIYRINHKSQVT